jgi:hypothetical protein
MQGLGQMSNTHQDMYSVGYKVNVNVNVKPTLFEQPFKHMFDNKHATIEGDGCLEE